ncbi:MAG: glycosyltransferase family 2 protein [Deltaproteobacteria bacterium]|nr:glycosyltransferase family 2 protein [Deltaproteobacteria bacterium]MBW1979511.1 glycosyltransferase family 2 protein [Deltaproteobacteria bacterium]MBW2046697.1 glycosyltransferase family 2 protein [Deltaproteobacteria bacterium]MBW2301677.1 glycosyltransferase family 2 protein [Deltaproteobacteria bacterium]
MGKPSVSIIIPAHNEAQTLREIIKKIEFLYPEFEIIVINDGSTDDTVLVAKEAGAIVYSHPYNIGNGAAIKSGIRIASGEVLVFMDGDGQHDPEDITKMLEYIPQYDMVVGARLKGHHASWGRALGNRLYSRFASYVAKFRIKDLTSGFRAIKAELAHNFLYLLPNTYSYPTTLTLAVLRSGRSVKYVPISTKDRKIGESKIRPFRDGIRFLMIILKICALYSPLRIFLPVSLFLFLAGLSYYLYTYFVWHRFTNMGALLFTTSIIIFMMGLISEQICQMRFEKSESERFI